MKLIGIARVSTEEQRGDDGQGLERQRIAIRGIAKSHRMQLLEIIEIIDVSGSDVAKSLEWQTKILPRIVDPDTHIAVDAMDRLIRASDFDAFTVLAACQGTKTRIYTPTAVQDFTKADDVFMAGLFALMGGKEKAEIRRRMNQGKEAIRRAGGWAAGYTPMGFKYDKKARKWSFTDDLPRVVRAFRQIADGESIYAVARELGQGDGNMHKILKNPIYRGVLEWSKQVGEPAKSRTDGKQAKAKRMIDRPTDQVISVRFLRAEDQPVSDALWTAVQEQMASIRGRRLARKSDAQGRCWATGHLCDGQTLFDSNKINSKPIRLFGSRHDRDHWRYQTSAATWSYHADKMNFALDRYLADLTDKSAFGRLVEAELRKAQACDPEVDRAGIQAQIAALKAKQKKANAKFDVDAITIGELQAETAKIRKAVDGLEAQLAKPIPVPVPVSADVLAAAQQVASWPLEGSAAAKREWLQRYGANVYVTPELIVTVQLRIPCLPKAFTFWDSRNAQLIEGLLDGFRPVYKQGYLTTTEVAHALGLVPSTLRKYLGNGKIPGPSSVVGGDGRRWTQADVDAARAALETLAG